MKKPAQHLRLVFCFLMMSVADALLIAHAISRSLHDSIALFRDLLPLHPVGHHRPHSQTRIHAR